MINILVVIDNIMQFDRIKKVFDSYKTKIVFDVDFKHSNVKSEIWNHPDFINAKESTVDVNEDAEILAIKYNLIISVHCFQFFPARLVKNVRCINIHPGYNPINRGWYPQVFAIINNLPIGATIHEMDEKLDNGGIIDRSFVPINIWDTSFSIYNRVLDKEIELFENNFEKIINNNYNVIVPENKGNLFTKKDFEHLKQIDLKREGTFMEFYNDLRALSHGEYKNAFFIDAVTGKKVFVKIDISTE